MPPLTFRIKRGIAVLTLACPPLSDGALRDALTALTRAGCRHAVLDLGEVAPDLALVKPLMTLRRRLARHNGRLVLCGLSAETADWLRSTWLQGLFEVRPDAAGAVACLVNGAARARNAKRGARGASPPVAVPQAGAASRR